MGTRAHACCAWEDTPFLRSSGGPRLPEWGMKDNGGPATCLPLLGASGLRNLQGLPPPSSGPGEVGEPWPTLPPHP